MVRPEAPRRGLGRDLRGVDDTRARLAGGMSLEEPLVPASDLIRRLEPELLANVFRWTGHFPERTRVLVRFLAERAGQLRQGYAANREQAAIVAFTTLVTGLAMNYVQRGSYLP